MRYDRLLQLGGIDREVPPVPRYISNEELQEEIDALNKKIGPNTVGTDEIIDGSVDMVDLSKNVKDKMLTDFKDVYIGVGAAYTDVMVAANHHASVLKGAPVSVTVSSNYIWVILPSSYTPGVRMGGIEVPMTAQSNVTVDEVTYKVLKSSNQYTGTFSISLV